MYLQKNGGRASAGRQSSDVLLRALAERHPSLGEHVHGVAELALAIGERLVLPPEELEDLRQAARQRGARLRQRVDALERARELKPAAR